MRKKKNEEAYYIERCGQNGRPVKAACIEGGDDKDTKKSRYVEDEKDFVPPLGARAGMGTFEDNVFFISKNEGGDEDDGKKYCAEEPALPIGKSACGYEKNGKHSKDKDVKPCHRPEI
jgi:hypothetical protein